MIDVSDIVAGFALTTATRRRRTGAYGADGVWSAASADTSIDVCIQPVTGRQRALLPEGVRERVVYLAHTLADVRGDSDGGQPGDLIVFGGDVFAAVEDRDFVAASHGDYRRILLAKVPT